LGILSGIISYIFGLSLNLLDASINGFLGALGFDLEIFEYYFPAAAQFHEIIVGFSVSLLFAMLVFQVFRNFGVVLDMEAEDPLKTIGKSALFLGMIVYSRSVIDLILGLMVDPYHVFLGTAATPYKFELTTLVTAIFNSVFSNPFMCIVAMILMMVLGWQFLKLTVECVERYIVFYFSLCFAPVVFATGAFKSTSQILKSWSRLVASQAMLLLINVWSIRLFLSYMPVFEQSGNDMVFTFLMGFAFLKFAQKADTLLRIIGLNTASTGDMVRSLGGTIAGIAMTIRSAGSMARGVASAIGGRFGGAEAAGGKGSQGGGGRNRGSGDEISGMGGRRKQGETKASGVKDAAAGGVTLSGISAAKQGFATDVMRAARARMEGGPFTAEGQSPAADGEAPAQGPDGKPSHNGKIPMKQGESSGKAASAKGFANLDEETLEGLSNLAHGLPHTKCDLKKGVFTGGGFPEFTGEDANIIGASQLVPARGFRRSMMKRSDGSIGTIYRNAETGEAQMVQFASVDNGVIQGVISRIDPKTGRFGEDFAFKAVHSSVPGAESFSSHSVPVRDPSGGVYHVATGADTSIFSQAPGNAQAASAYTPGGANQMSAAGSDGKAVATEKTAGRITPEAGTAAGGGTNIVSPIPTKLHDADPAIEKPSEAPLIPSPAAPTGGQEIRRETALHHETPSPVHRDADAAQAAPGMQPPQNKVRRFSRSNPANLEVFRRDDSRLESFEKQKPDPGAQPGVTPMKK